jgi:5-carboxymethyl-2-hydroxymuconate isomerase
MPHLTILYTPDLDAELDMSALCRALADTMVALRDDAGAAVFPTGGVRVLAFPAAHVAIADGGAAGIAADGSGDYAFAYLQLRMGRGRSDAVQQAAGRALAEVAGAHFAPVVARRHVGVTFQVDEGREVFDAKQSSLHPLFAKR